MLSYHIEQLRLSNGDRWYVTQYDPMTLQIMETVTLVGSTPLEICNEVLKTVLTMERQYVGKEARREEAQERTPGTERIAQKGEQGRRSRMGRPPRLP